MNKNNNEKINQTEPTNLQAIIGFAVVAAIIYLFAGGSEDKTPATDSTKQQVTSAPAQVTKAPEPTNPLPDDKKAAIAANLQTIANALQENANNKQFIKNIGVKSITIKADTENIDTSNFGGLDITIYVAKELPQHKTTAKDFVDAIINKYKADTNQDVLFNISAKLFSDTKMDSVKHYYARAKYLPQIRPVITVEDKDYLVDITK